MSRRSRKPKAIEVLEVMGFVPTTPRRAWRIARVKQDGVEFAELRSCNLSPAWQPSPTDHRSVLRGAALRRIIAGLQAIEAKLGEQS